MGRTASTSALRVAPDEWDPAALPRQTRIRQHLHAVPTLKHTQIPTPPKPEELPIPPPDPRIVRMIAIYGYEVVDGSRSVTQLAAWITREVADHLTSRRAARTERRTLYRDERRTVPVPGPVHLSLSSAKTAEAAVVLQTGARFTAVAVRLEYLREKWRATNLTVL
ncbi:hypothetical protein G7067_00515 [Leucobacter insecticola]|uniref:Uncharacterized protein n=1 Tax=Leucobacter insecticola TaxID=2714934 RepID=A0A6G8FFX6_9MICO|nr:Rv3235 family protein [Leucobacter insecticola]QIM15237.1 hypothetical protein G7067_00515 [Leucobacter insecticola]